ncbi:uncharacterized protein RSE6_01491 [Rhynchosporium secalis]|uniref:Uncharacterized protein n=1 Tax=Rhynchosporium secalis TaxID=38038 RepID=A0A1E1LZL4_RHYSE|nr:uncharacterized protein RSE6_01491 [Rhynchosporium secalis]
MSSDLQACDPAPPIAIYNNTTTGFVAWRMQKLTGMLSNNKIIDLSAHYLSAIAPREANEC